MKCRAYEKIQQVPVEGKKSKVERSQDRGKSNAKSLES